MSGDYFLFLVIFVSLAMIGMKKAARGFDKDGKVHKAAQDGVVNWIGRLFK